MTLMKKTLIILGTLAALLSCNKEESITVQGPESEEYVLALDGTQIDVDVRTKATAITAIPSSLYWAATIGTSGSSETRKYASTSSTVSSSQIRTGKYQTSVPTTYNWYVANQAISTPTSAGAATLIVANNSTDIIAGVCKANDTTAPSVVLGHVFARTGTLTLNTQTHESGKAYILDNVVWKIQSKAGGTGGTAGTYNIGNGSWSSVTALGKTTFGTVAVASTTENKNVQTSDLYVTPGIYTLTIAYTLKLRNDDNTVDYIKDVEKSVDVTLVGGAINNIEATSKGGDAQEIIITVSLTPWATHNITAILPED